MTDPQAYDIAEFLHMRVEAAANRFGYKLQNIVTGDAKSGEAYFNSHCQSCHSSTGDLAHIGKTESGRSASPLPFIPTQPPRNSPLPSPWAPGKTVTGVLKHLDDFDVSLIDASGEYRAFSRDTVKLSVNDPLAAHRVLLAKYTDADMHNVLAYLVTLK